MFAWEFIWRGFTLFGLEKKFGWYAVFIQMIPFVILHNGKPFLETFGAILGGIGLGIIALRTRSVYYCIIIHLGVIYSIDILSVLRYRANDYGVGFESFINLLKQFF
jgi:membrane protease YdiL (CAAX protease family)